MDTFDITIEGDREAGDALGRVAAGVSDPREPLREAGRILGNSQAERIRAGGDPSYPDVTPETRRRRRGDRTAPPLIDTGELIKAVLAGRPVAGRTFRAVYEIADGVLTKGVAGDPVDRLQKGFHGTDAAGRRIDQPARPFVTATPGDERDIRSAYQRFLDARIDKEFS